MTSRGLDIDLSRFRRAIRAMPTALLAGAKRGMHDVLDDWEAEAFDVAPIDKSTLRQSINAGEIKRRRGMNLEGELSANAIETYSGGRFNYAYYIHEEDAGGKNLRTGGTEKQFLDVPLERNKHEWVRHIESEIHSELRRRGW
ncbi:HK97 gp10 family phage protein [Cohnella mopanensis]|uniref:HK97 gp10 family phage protein n=1 Tax=Cohnella mopanensis TaxID=2911966 RepID=UPI001EF831E3|nr:HK97 gp10 family phage protein [Cohnella mopanensis]